MPSHWGRAGRTRPGGGRPGAASSVEPEAAGSREPPLDGAWRLLGRQALYADLGHFSAAFTGRSLACPGRRMNLMGDVWYLGLTVLFFGLTWAFVALCDRV